MNNKGLLIDKVSEAAQASPAFTAYNFMGNKKSLSEFMEQINEAALAFSSVGVKENDIICIAMPNTPQAVIAIYAANKIGAVVNMIHPLSSEKEMLDFVNRVNAKTILILDQFYDSIKNIIDKTSLKNIITASISDGLSAFKSLYYRKTAESKYKIPVGTKGIIRWKEFIKLSKNTSALPEISDRTEKTAFILHSGGTTGKIKGVCLSNKSVNDMAQQIIEASPMFEKGDRFLSVMPIFHGNGLVVGVHAMLLSAVTCVLIPRFTPESYAKDLLKYKCNYISGVPSLFERLMEVDALKNADLSFLKAVISGADYLSVALERRLNEFLKNHNANISVRQGYGMTEGVVAATLNPYDRQKEGSIGVPFNGVSVKIIEPGTENEVPVGETGEIVFSSTTNMLGYYNDPEETSITLKQHKDGKFWIHSGDLGSKDEDGFFYFKGRIKRMIVSNGYNVFPNELENIIEGFEMVDKCCVLGVHRSEGTEQVKAFILLKEGYSPSQEMKDEIKAHCRESIAKYALPREIEFVDKMPTTKVGKIDYKALLK